jgi:hypothetical protein
VLPSVDEEGLDVLGLDEDGSDVDEDVLSLVASSMALWYEQADSPPANMIVAVAAASVLIR